MKATQDKEIISQKLEIFNFKKLKNNWSAIIRNL